jgi:cystathionine beta-lyase/cystathionine gamma-synthase
LNFIMGDTPTGPQPNQQHPNQQHPDQQHAHEHHSETRAITAGRKADGSALSPTLWTTTAFQTPSFGAAAKMARQPRPREFYARYGNPTVGAFEDAIASLEGAEAARAFASGMGAVYAVIFSMLSTGGHIVAQRQIYGGTTTLLTSVCPRFGIDVTFVDGTKPGAFAEAIRPGKTQLVIAETPTNPWLELVDLKELGGLLPITMVDSTFATPLGQTPLSHGVNLVVHSATKAICGHNDASLGVVAGDRDLIDWIWGFAVLQGANASATDAMNGLRGIRTLGARLRQQSESSVRIASFLDTHEAVGKVAHLGLPTHPQADLYARQMTSPGGLLSFELSGGEAAAIKLIDSVNVFRIATSLGGPESLVTHPSTTTHVGLTDEEKVEQHITPGLVRLSVGLEHADDLIADLSQALA